MHCTDNTKLTLFTDHKKSSPKSSLLWKNTTCNNSFARATQYMHYHFHAQNVEPKNNNDFCRQQKNHALCRSHTILHKTHSLHRQTQSTTTTLREQHNICTSTSMYGKLNQTTTTYAENTRSTPCTDQTRFFTKLMLYTEKHNMQQQLCVNNTIAVLVLLCATC